MATGPTVDKLEKAWTNCDMYMRTVEPTRHAKTCLSLTSFRLTVMGELQKFAIMLQAYFVKDKEIISKKSARGGFILMFGRTNTIM